MQLIKDLQKDLRELGRQPSANYDAIIRIRKKIKELSKCN